MKKLFIALTGVLALISLVSCQKENLEKEELPNKEGVTVKIVSGAGTKTYAVDGEIPTIYWSEGDYVAFFEVVDGTYHEAVYSNDAVINGRKASFSATLTSEDPAGSSYKYAAVYPGSCIGNYGDQDDDGENDWFILLPDEQSLNKGNMSLDSDILISEQLDNGSERIENNTESLFTFHRLGTVVRLQLKGITAGEIIKTVTIHAPTKVAGYIKYDIATSQAADNYYQGYGDITLNLGDVTATGDDVIWFRVFSPENWSSFGIEVVTSDGKYLRDGSDESHAVIVPAKPIQFINEGLTKFAVNLADYRIENEVKSVPYVENFDTDNSAEWVFIDSDGDEYNWDWNTSSTYTISGKGILQSSSYVNNVGALTPDNWAFTPAIQLTEGNVLSFWVAAQDPSWQEEHYAVYITEENPGAGLPGAYTRLFEETIGSGSYTPAQTREVDGRTYNRYFVNIPAAFNNKIAYIGFRHFDCTDMFRMNIDNVMVTEGNPDPEPEPEPEPDPTWLEDFESESTLTAWTFIDSDEDGDNWQIGYSPQLKVHSGTGVLYSQSYDYDSSTPLNPDNWAFTPGIPVTSGNYLSFWVAPQDPNYPQEHYAVYITDQAPNASNLASCVRLHEETIDGTDAATPVETSGNFSRFIIAIPDQFANKTVYIGFRHFNCSDWFWLDLDDVAIYDTNPKEASSGTIFSAAPMRSSSKAKSIYSADRKDKSKTLTRK